MPDVNAAMARLAELWLGEEYHDLKIEYEYPTYGNPGYWQLHLTAASDRSYSPYHDHGADWVEYAWTFYGETVAEVVTDALDFALALKALAPKDEE